MADEGRTWHWRNTMKPVRFFQFDARSVVFALLALMHARVWTVELLVGVNLIFWILERKGLSFASALRALRLWFTGKYRPAWIFTRRREMIDTGST